MSRIKYPKIASDLKPILAVLVESGFLQDGRSTLIRVQILYVEIDPRLK